MDHTRVALNNVTVGYGRRLALENITGQFPPGSLTAVVGANGAGKSTLLGTIAGTVRLTSGTVHCPARTARRLAYLPQSSALDRDYPVTVAELIALGAWRSFGVFRAPTAAMQTRVADVAQTVGLTNHLRRPIDALSIGELQRTLFARLILQDASVILLDEPFAAVDAATTVLLLGQIDRWHAEGRTIIAVLHDLDLVRARFPTTLVLARRCVSWGPTPTALAA